MKLQSTVFALTVAGAAQAPAQAPVATDLWRVAAATLAVPEALADGPSASLWNPSSAHRPDLRRHVLGIEVVSSPPEMGVAGVVASVSRRQPGVGTVTLLYGRMGIEDLSRTETSPEALAGGIPVYSQLVSFGFATDVSPRLRAGAALRSLRARLGDRAEQRTALDAGGTLELPWRLTLAASTRFFDPAMSSGRTSASHSAALAWQPLRLRMWGAAVALSSRLGVTSGPGERARLAGAGLDASGRLLLDLAAVQETAFGRSAWRARVAVALASGPYRITMGRDSGTNGFGATYRFALAAGLQ